MNRHNQESMHCQHQANKVGIQMYLRLYVGSHLGQHPDDTMFLEQVSGAEKLDPAPQRRARLKSTHKKVADHSRFTDTIRALDRFTSSSTER